MKIGLIDADLLDEGTNFPNLALMKLSAYYKNKKNKVRLLTSYKFIASYDKIFISKVFTKTKIPNLTKYKNIIYGGTGFFFDKSPKLPKEIEHIKPDYNLYKQSLHLVKNHTDYYTNYSIGFTTRGCFRKCKFCINRHSNKVTLASPIKEFLDKKRPYICLLDDNIFGTHHWESIFKELQKTNKLFQYKQGLDFRLLTDKKAKFLLKSKHKGDYIFAFDNYKEKKLIEQKLKLWYKHWKAKKHCTKVYVLCAFENQGLNDIIKTFKRIKILIKYGCHPYIMRYKKYKSSRWEGIYTNLAGWCNQPHLLTKMSFREYSVLKGMGKVYKKYKKNWNQYMVDGNFKYKSWRVIEEFEQKYPKIAKKYFNFRFDEIYKKRRYNGY